MQSLRYICFCVFFLRLLVQSVCERRNIIDDCTVQKMEGSASFILVCTIQKEKDLARVATSIKTGNIFGRRRLVREADINKNGAARRFLEVRHPKSNSDCNCLCEKNNQKVYWVNYSCFSGLYCSSLFIYYNLLIIYIAFIYSLW